jgi:hypothetical protein
MRVVHSEIGCRGVGLQAGLPVAAEAALKPKERCGHPGFGREPQPKKPAVVDAPQVSGRAGWTG